MLLSSVTRFAPAKINLALHVTGQRPDGYHLLESLVVFADVGDRVTVSKHAGDAHQLEVCGPFADALSDCSLDDNLLIKAAKQFGGDQKFAFLLEKNLPVASGIGGGSADCAAAAHGIIELLGLEQPAPQDLLPLGADVPVCFAGVPALMRGVGEDVLPLGHMSRLPMLLVNPLAGISTPQVFNALQDKDNPPLVPKMPDKNQILSYLSCSRNDLEAPAFSVLPIIGDVLALLREQTGAQLVRMSGSGATCFALFETIAEAEAARDVIAYAQPDWWCVPCSTLVS